MKKTKLTKSNPILAVRVAKIAVSEFLTKKSIHNGIMETNGENTVNQTIAPIVISPDQIVIKNKHIKYKRKRVAFFLSTIIVLYLFSFQSSSAVSGAQTNSFALSGYSSTQSYVVTLPTGAKALSVATNNGSASFVQTGTNVTVTVSGGSGSTYSYQYISDYTTEQVQTGTTTEQVQTGTTTEQVQTGTEIVAEPRFADGHVGPPYNGIPVGSVDVTVPVYTTETVPVYTTETVPVYTTESIPIYSTSYYTIYNYSVTLTYVVDTTPPAGSYTLSKTTETNNPVTITITGSDDVSGVASITLPNKSVVTATTTTYTVSANGTYNFTLTDYAGNTTTLPVTVSNIDTTPPSTPANLTYSLDSSNNAILRWTASADNNSVAGYYIYRNGTQYATTTTNTYTDKSVSPGIKYVYTIKAYDEVNNISTQSNAITVSALNSTINTAAVITAGTTVTDSLASASDVKFYKISKTVSDDFVEANILNPNTTSTYLPYTVAIYGPDQSLLSTGNAANAKDYIRCHVSAAGYYYISVSYGGSNFTTSNNFTLIVK